MKLGIRLFRRYLVLFLPVILRKTSTTLSKQLVLALSSRFSTAHQVSQTAHYAPSQSMVLLFDFIETWISRNFRASGLEWSRAVSNPTSAGVCSRTRLSIGCPELQRCDSRRLVGVHLHVIVFDVYHLECINL